jgi:hypothetical protein
VKRKSETPTVSLKPDAGNAGDDKVVAPQRHHLLDAFAARPRLRPGRSGRATKE